MTRSPFTSGRIDTVTYSDRAGVTFEACEPGTAARLRRMERIVKKYLRRAEIALEAMTERCDLISAAARAEGWDVGKRTEYATCVSIRNGAESGVRVLSDILSA